MKQFMLIAMLAAASMAATSVDAADNGYATQRASKNGKVVAPALAAKKNWAETFWEDRFLQGGN
jgi:hypothetical protein